MAVLGTIGGVPVYSTIQEALNYARANGLTGYHTHVVSGVVGYMGGSSHSTATGSRQSNIQFGPLGGTTNITSGGSTGGGGGGY